MDEGIRSGEPPDNSIPPQLGDASGIKETVRDGGSPRRQGLRQKSRSIPRPSENVDIERRVVAKPNRRLIRWFFAGFFIVFLSMWLIVPVYVLNPDGNAVTRCTLGEYYIIEFARRLNSTNTLGPATGSATTLLSDAMLQMAFSVFGGAVSVAIRLLIYKIRDRFYG